MTRTIKFSFRTASKASRPAAIFSTLDLVPRPLASAVALALLSFNAGGIGELLAAPTGGQVTAGAATIQQSNAQTTVINQTTPRAALNWNSFSIGAGESVVFQQPSASAVALNRVVGSQPSAIYGSLQANGNVFLVNPNGVLFARGASVDVGGLVASTLNIANADFMAGRYAFTGGSGSGAVVNHAMIRAADGGYVAFLGNQVTNTGTIVANKGSVALGAGDSMLLDFDGDGLLNLKVNTAAANARVDHGGLIQADGGRVLMSVRAKNALLATALNVDGIVNARGLTERNGAIYLDGGRSGVTSVTGKLDASTVHAGQRGGEIQVLGEYVGLFGNATLDASGAAGGGTVLVGGDFQGRNAAIPNALRTYVGPEATIKADAIERGDGGKVIVWADDVTRFYGSLSARGGEGGGNGGFAEVSGHGSLLFGGSVNLRASRGAAGTLLLDPTDIEVALLGTDSNGDVAAFGNATCGVANNSSACVISPVTLNTGGANVILLAQNDITFTDPVNLLLTANANLTAQAGRSITVNSTIATNGSGRITLVANNTDNLETDAAGGALTGSGGTNRGASNADLLIRAAVSSGSGAIKLVNSGSVVGGGVPGGIELGANVSTTGNVTISAAGSAIARTAGTVSGNVVSFLARNGIVAETQATRLTATNTTTGNIVLTQTGAVTLGDAGVGLSTGGGNGSISVTATGTITVGENISANGSGTVTLTATGGASNIATNAPIDSGSGLITLQADNDVTINGTVGATTTGGITITADTDGNAAGAMSNGSAIGSAVAAGPILLQGADIAIGAAVSGGGALTLQPSTAGSSISVAGAAGVFTVGAADILNLADGFSSITIGRANGSGTTTIDPVSFGDPVVIRQPSGGTVTVNGQITGTQNASVTLTAGSIGLNNNIVTSGRAISLNGPVILGANVLLDPTNAGATAVGGGISFSSTIDADNAVANDRTLTLNAGTGGAISVTGAVGATPLAGLTITNSNGATFSAPVTVTDGAGTIAITNTTGTVSFANDVTATALTTANNPYNVSLTGSTVQFTNDVNFLNTGTVTLGDAGTDVLRFLGGLATSGNVSNPSTTRLGGAVRTSGNQIDLGPAALIGNATIDTTNAGASPAGADIVLSTINADNNTTADRALAILAGTGGTVSFNGNVGAAVNGALADLDVTAGTAIRLNSATVNVNDADSPAATATFTGPVQIGTGVAAVTINTDKGSGAGNGVNFTSTINSSNDAAVDAVLNVVAGGGTVTFGGNIGAVAAGAMAGLNVTAATINLNAPTINVNDDNAPAQTVTFTGPVTLGSNVAITTDKAAGVDNSVTFTSTINGANSLTLTGGTGNVLLQGAVGGGARPTSVTASGNTINLQAVSTTGAQSYTGTTSTTLNGNLNSNTAGAITVTGPALLGGPVTVQTAGLAATDDITFTSTINNAQSLILNAGAGDVLVQGIIGGVTPLSSFAATGNTIDLLTVNSAGPVTLTTDDITLSPINASGQTVTLRNRTAGRVISVGTEVGGTLGLSAAEINTITAGTLLIGRNDGTASGAITVTSDIAPLNIDNLHLSTGAGVTATAGGITLPVGTGRGGLAIEAGGAVSVTDPQTAITTLAANVGGGGTLNFTQTNGFNVGIVDGVTGITTANADVTLTSGGALGVDRAIAAGGGAVRLDAASITQNATTGAITAAGLRTLTSGSTVLDSNLNDVTTYAGQATGAGTITYTDATTFDVGTVALLSGVATNNQNFRLTAGAGGAGNLTMSQALNAGLGTITLVAQNGSIAENAGATINAATLGLLFRDTSALTQVGNTVGTLGASVTGLNQGFSYRDNDALIIGAAPLVPVTGIAMNGGAVTLTAATGDLTLANGISGAGTVTLNATTGALVQNAGATITATTLAGIAGTTATLAEANAITNLAGFTTANGFTLSDGGGLTVTADVAGGAGLASITTSGLLTINAGQTVSGTGVTLAATGGTSDLALNGSANAGAGTLTLNAGRAITQGAGSVATAGTLTGSAGSTATLAQANAITNLGAFTTVGGFTLVDGGGLTVTGDVAGGTGLASITTSGLLTVNAGQTLSGTGVTLAATGGGSDIALNGSANAGAGTLTVNAGGAITQGVGSVATAGTLTGTAGTTATLGQINAITNLGAFTAGNGFTLNDGAGGLTLTGAVAGGTGGVSLTTAGGALALQANNVSGAGGVTLQGAGVTSTGGTITTTAAANSGLPSGAVLIVAPVPGTISLAGNIVTTGGSNLAGPGGAGGDVTITTNNGPITVANVTTSGGAATGGNNNGGNAGAIAFTGGAASPITVNGNLTAKGGDAFGSGAAGSGRSITLTGPVLLGGNLTFDAQRGAGVGAATHGDVSFTSTVQSSGGARSLTVNTGGTTTFGGAVGGGVNPLSSLTTGAGGTTAINAGAITTTGAQTYNDAVTIVADTTLTSTGAGVIAFADTVNGPATLTVNTAGATTFGGVVGGVTPLGSLSTGAGGTTTFTAGAVTTTGAQSYSDALNLVTNSTFTSTGAGALTFSGAVNGPFALAANTAGVTTFGAPVGGGAALISLSTDAVGTTTISGGSVRTSGGQSYLDAVTLGADATITSTGSGAVSFAGVVNGAFGLTVNTAGATTFGGAVGSVTPLTTVTTDAPGTMVINASGVTTTGDQTYNDAMTLGANATFNAGAGNLTFANTINGAFALSANSTGTTTFGAPVGAGTPLAAVATNAGGTTAINGGSVMTSGAQTYGDPVTFGTNTTLTSTAGGAITFAGTVNGAINLIANTSGTTGFGGPVTLASLTTDAPGLTSVSSTVTTTGNQTFGDAVILAGNPTLTSNAGNIAFGGNVDADAAANNRSLTVNTSAGSITFLGNVGSAQALADLDLTPAGTIVFSGSAPQSVNVSAQGGNTVSFNAPLVLGQNVAITTDGAVANNVTFASTVNSDAVANNRTLRVGTGTGTATFAGGVGNSQELGAFVVSGNRAIVNGDIRVSGGGAVDFSGLSNLTFTPLSVIDTDAAGGATPAGPVLFGAATKANAITGGATWTIDASADGGALSGGVVVGTIGDTSPLARLDVKGEAVTFAGNVNATQVFVTANGVMTTTGVIIASKSFTNTDEINVALKLQALTGDGVFGTLDNPIRIDAPGLFVVLPNASNLLPFVFLAGDPSRKPVYEFADDSSRRLVLYNGVTPDTPASRAALSAALAPLREVISEVLQAGFAKENIRRQLLQGMVLEAGLARPGIDEFSGDGVTPPAACSASAQAGNLVCQ